MKVACVHEPRVGGHPVASGESYHIAGDERSTRAFCPLAVAQDWP